MHAGLTQGVKAMDKSSGGKWAGASKALAVFGAFAGLWVASLLGAGAAVAQDQPVQVVELEARKYQYSPVPVHVKAGTKVQLKITAVDHDHGFKLTVTAKGDTSGKPGLVLTSPQDCWQLKKGTTTTIEFVAQTAGTYAFKCCHVCGLGHGGMHSEIIVE
ncbi:MAG TPA: cupredoxin domain-containing protein [Candidatus Acidoferrum sp.]|nr:cupredoxin domain-containing protein [Candidatus Acidoferrum sp.]